MANVTVQACLEAWLEGVADKGAQLAAMRARFGGLAGDDALAAIDAAVHGLPEVQQHTAYIAVLHAIIAKAGGAGPGGLEGIVGGVVDGDDDLESGNTERFQAAARALNYGHYLRAMGLYPALRPATAAAVAAGPAPVAPIVAIRQQMAAHIGDSAMALQVLAGDPLPAELQAPATMDAETARAYYARLVGAAADPTSLAGEADTPLAALATNMQNWYVAQQLIDAGFVGEASEEGQLAAMYTALHTVLGKRGLVAALVAAQAAIFQHMPTAARLLAYQSVMAGPLDEVAQRIKQQSLEGALVVAERATTAGTRHSALLQALDGDPNTAATAPLFVDVPPGEHWRVMQAMVQVAQAHAAEIPAGQTPLQWLQAHMDARGSADVQRELHFGVAAALPARPDCARAQANRIIAADPGGRSDVCMTLLGLLSRSDQPAVLAALGRIVTGDVAGLPRQVNLEASRAAAQLVALGSMTAPINVADRTDSAVIYRAAVLALGLERDDALPANMAAYMLSRNATDRFAPQRAQAALQEMARLVEGGMPLADARERVDAALAAPAAGREAEHTDTHRRIRLREAAAIAALAPADPGATPVRPVTRRRRNVGLSPQQRSQLAAHAASVREYGQRRDAYDAWRSSVSTAFAEAVGLPAGDLTPDNLDLVGAGAAGGRRRSRGAAPVSGMGARAAAVLGDAAQAMLGREGAVPQFADMAALCREPAMVAAQQLKRDDDLSAARTAIAAASDGATRQAAVQAILQAFGHTGDAAAADALLTRMQTAMGGEPDAPTWRVALTAVLNTVNHRAVNAAAAQAMLGGAQLHPALQALLAEQDYRAGAGRLFAQLPATLREDTDDRRLRAANSFVLHMALQRAIKAVLDEHPEAVRGQRPEVMAARAMAAIPREFSGSVNHAAMLGWAAAAATGQADGSVVTSVGALQQAVIEAGGLALDDVVAGLDDKALEALYSLIQERYDGNDAAVRAFVNAVTLANAEPRASALTVNELLTIVAMANGTSSLAQPLPEPLDPGARERRVAAVAAVLQVEQPEAVPISGMAAVARRVATLVAEAPAEAAFYGGYVEGHATAQVRPALAATRLLHANPAERAAAAEAGEAAHAAATLRTGGDAAAVTRALAVEDIVSAANRAATPREAMKAMFAALYRADAQARGLIVSDTVVDRFVDAHMGYLDGNARATSWRGTWLQGDFEALRRDMVAVATGTTWRGRMWDPSDMSGRARLTDEQRRDAMLAAVQQPAAYQVVAQGAEGMAQLQIQREFATLVAKVQGKGGIPATLQADLQAALERLHASGVIRLEDAQEMVETFHGCKDRPAVREFLQGVVRDGWDFSTARVDAASQALGFVAGDGAPPVEATSLSARANAAVAAIQAATTDLRVQVTKVPGLVVKERKVGEIQTGDAELLVGNPLGRDATTGRITLRRDGGATTLDSGQVGNMALALAAANPEGGSFRPTARLANEPALLAAALTQLANQAKARGVKWTITLPPQAQSKLPQPLSAKLANAGVMVQSAVSPTRPQPGRVGQADRRRPAMSPSAGRGHAGATPFSKAAASAARAAKSPGPGVDHGKT